MSEILSQSQFQKLFNDRLNRFFDGQIAHAQTVEPAFGELVHIMADFIGSPSAKRIRPYLSYVVYQGYGGDDQEMCFDAGLALELFHNFLLIHDDIIDRDTVRYGKVNITGSYLQNDRIQTSGAPRHYADMAALLAGDLNSSFAVDQLCNLSCSDRTKITLLKSLTRTSFEVLAGEYLDTFLPLDGTAPGRDRSQVIMQYKTASYSFINPLQVGAILAEAGSSENEKLIKVGLPAGLAYQIKDDLDGVYGDPAKTGKSVTGDLQEGKHTLLLALAYERGTYGQREYLSKNVGRSDLSPREHESLRQVLIETGAKAEAERIAGDLMLEASEKIVDLQMEDEAKAKLSKLFTVNM